MRAISLAMVVVLAAMAAVAAAIGRSPAEVVSDGRARDAGRRFLDTYVGWDGRVVRRDQDSDTVSEGQAYGMWVAAALGDEQTFRQIWWWTRTHLQRTDGLLSHSWTGRSVADPQPATDADLDAAHALLLAAERFDDPVLRDDALQIARGILAEETARTLMHGGPTETATADEQSGPGLVLVAGPWAHPRNSGTQRSVINPSYFSQPAFAALAAATKDPAWMTLDASSHRLLRALVGRGALPPDWAAMDHRSGEVQPIGGPDEPEAPPLHGFDAARVTIRAAASCEPAWRDLAASAASIYPAADDIRIPLRLDGRPAGDARHPVMLVAAAAAAYAAGEPSVSRLLDEAERLEHRHPSYYGAAWVALGRLWFETPVGDCP